VSLQWKQEYAMLQTLRPQVATATSDADVRVRRAALLALGNLDYSGRPDSETPVSDATLEVLRVMFHSDSDGKIRQEVMKAVALRPNPETAIGDFLLSGLDDAVPGVRQYAIVAAARVRSTASMPRVADALRDSDDGVRMAATSALGRYGSAARPYLPELRAALSAERNNRIRAQMERCLLAIQK